MFFFFFSALTFGELGADELTATLEQRARALSSPHSARVLATRNNSQVLSKTERSF